MDVNCVNLYFCGTEKMTLQTLNDVSLPAYSLVITKEKRGETFHYKTVT
jgi:hypothetical protein